MADKEVKPVKVDPPTPAASACAGVAALVEKLRAQDASGHKVKPDDFDALAAAVSGLANIITPPPPPPPPSDGGPGEEKPK